MDNDEAISALGLLSRMRFACGDNGLRMQDELEEYLRGLKRDSDELAKLRAEIAGARVQTIDASCMVIVHSDMIGQRVALLRLPAGEGE